MTTACEWLLLLAVETKVSGEEVTSMPLDVLQAKIARLVAEEYRRLPHELDEEEQPGDLQAWFDREMRTSKHKED